MSRLIPCAKPIGWQMRRLAALLFVLFATLSLTFSGSPVGAQGATQVPAQPTGLEVTTEQGSLDVSLDWDDVDGATSYLVRWRAAGPGNPLNEGTRVDASGATITVGGEGEWVVRLEACNDAGCGEHLAQRFTVEPAPEPDAEAEAEPEPEAEPREAESEAASESLTVESSDEQPNRAPVVNADAAGYDAFVGVHNAPPGVLVWKSFEGLFSDPDGDDLAYTVSVPDDRAALVEALDLHKTRPLVGLQHDEDDDWGAIVPALPDPVTTEITLTATDPEGLSASLTGSFRADWDSRPVLTTAEVHRRELRLTFDQNLWTYPVPAPDQFTVNVWNEDGSSAGRTREVGNVLVYSNLVVLDLRGVLSDGETLTLDYTHHNDRPLRRLVGGDSASSFTGQPVSVENATKVARQDTTTATANAGGDQEVWGWAEVQLMGSGSSTIADPTFTYQWIQTSGPTVRLSSTKEHNPTFRAPLRSTDQVLVFSLVVNDGTNDSAADTVTVTVRALVDLVTIDRNQNRDPYNCPPIIGTYTSGFISSQVTNNSVTFGATGTSTVDLYICGPSYGSAFSPVARSVDSSYRHTANNLASGTRYLIAAKSTSGSTTSGWVEVYTTGPASTMLTQFSKSPDSGGTYTTDETIQVRVVWFEPVTVNNGGSNENVFLHLDLGPNDDVQTNSLRKMAWTGEGSGTNTLTFGYTVGSTDEDDVDDDLLFLQADSAGTIVFLEGGATINHGGLRVTAAPRTRPFLRHWPPYWRVDGSPAAAAVDAVSITSVPSVDSDGDDWPDTYRQGDVVEVEVAWSRGFTWDASASGSSMRVPLDLGGQTRYADLVTGSQTSGTAQRLRFQYTVQAADTDTDGVFPKPTEDGDIVELVSGATLKNSEAVDVSRQHAGLAADAGHKVNGGLGLDTARPAIESATVTGTDLQVVFDEWLAGDDPAAAAFTLGTGSTTPTRAYIAGNRLFLTTPSDYGAGDSPASVTYDPTKAVNRLKDSAGNTVAAFTQPVTRLANRGLGTLVSNTGQKRSRYTSLRVNDAGQMFTTGGNPGGYKLTAVRMKLERLNRGAVAPTLTVSICPADAVTPSATCLGTLTSPSSPSSLFEGINQFTAPGGGIDLDASTNYFVVVQASGVNLAGVRSLGLSLTSAKTEDPKWRGGNWSIADRRLEAPAGTGSWGFFSGSYMIAVLGHKKGPESVAISSVPSVDADADDWPDTYRQGDMIEVTVTWDHDVTWDLSASGSAMRVPLDLGSGTKPAGLVTGGQTSGTAQSLRFQYTVQAADTDTDGVFPKPTAAGDIVELVSGATLKAAGDVDASRQHAGLAADPLHKVNGSLGLDTEAPAIESATAGGTHITIVFDEWLSGDAPAAAAFTVMVGGEERTLTEAEAGVFTIPGVSVGVRYLTLVLDEAVLTDQPVSVAYDPTKAVNPLKDRAGNEVGAFTQSVTNTTGRGSGTPIDTTWYQIGVTHHRFNVVGAQLTQGFTTGTKSPMYKLTEVVLPLSHIDGTSGADPTFAVSICEDASTRYADSIHPNGVIASYRYSFNASATCLGTLTSPSSITDGDNTFTVPDGGFDLKAGTRYWVMVEVTAAGGKAYQYSRTTSPAVYTPIYFFPLSQSAQLDSAQLDSGGLWSVLYNLDYSRTIWTTAAQARPRTQGMRSTPRSGSLSRATASTTTTSTTTG